MEQDVKKDIRWQTYEYTLRHKTADWYWALGIVAAALAAAALMLNNALFAVTIAVGTIALALVSRQRPGILTCELNERGIAVNDHFYPYSRFKAFGIDEEVNPAKLILRQSGLGQEIIIPLEHNAAPIREFLERFIPEEEELREPMAHRVMEYLGF
jgi:hypothetical protein